MKKLPARWIPQLSANTWIRIAAGLVVVLGFFINEIEWVEVRFVQQMELLAYDQRLRLFMPNTLDTRVVILDIDEKSLNAEGRWPWSRDKVALMVRQLFDKYGVRVVGFDIAFAEADTSSGLTTLDSLAKNELKNDAEYLATLNQRRASLDYDQILADEVLKHPVVLGFFLGGKIEKSGTLPSPILTDRTVTDKGWVFKHHAATGFSGNVDQLQKNATAAGHLYPALDFDGLVRRVPMLMKYADGYYESLSLAITRTYLGNVPLKAFVRPPDVGNLATIWRLQIGDIHVPLDERMTSLVP